MSVQRLIVSMGTGRARVATQAAQAAIDAALANAALPILDTAPEGLQVHVRLGAPEPEEVQIASLSAALPGDLKISVVPGGLRVADGVFLAAAIEVFLPRR